MTDVHAAYIPAPEMTPKASPRFTNPPEPAPRCTTTRLMPESGSAVCRRSFPFPSDTHTLSALTASN